MKVKSNFHPRNRFICRKLLFKKPPANFSSKHLIAGLHRVRSLLPSTDLYIVPYLTTRSREGRRLILDVRHVDGRRSRLQWRLLARLNNAQHERTCGWDSYEHWLTTQGDETCWMHADLPPDPSPLKPRLLDGKKRKREEYPRDASQCALSPPKAQHWR